MKLKNLIIYHNYLNILIVFVIRGNICLLVIWSKKLTINLFNYTNELSRFIWIKILLTEK